MDDIHIKIVIVDDNAKAAVILSMFFETEGHSVLLAISGQSGIDLVCAAQPDMAIVDYACQTSMDFKWSGPPKKAPEMSECSFLMLTGKSTLNAPKITAEVGVARFFTKGFRPESAA